MFWHFGIPLSKVDINLLIKLTRFNFVSHRGSIKSMTKNTVNTINDLFVGIWARGEVFKYLWAIFSSLLDSYLGADNLGAHTGIPVSKCLWIRH